MYTADVKSIRRADEDWTELEGKDCGAGVSLIFVSTEEVGAGPRLHQHPYSETFLIRAGEALFTVDTEQFIGVAGQVLVVPPGTPHKFSKQGSGRLEMIDVHASPVFITEWLE
jgi:mannose-6-phosphate isomerase-like protein (cupin superfamily)